MENVEQKFNDIKKQTDSGFHDASLTEIKYNFENRIFVLDIEHCIFNSTENIDLVYLSKFSFIEVESLEISGFFNKSNKRFTYEISSFNFESDLFVLVGIDGGLVKIKSRAFDYTKQKINEYKY